MKGAELVALAVGAAIQPQFPAWEKIDVPQILKPVPTWVQADSPLGSVGKFPKLEALPDRCAVLEAGRVVGYRVSC